jgi:endogenous inhibitor of DNA gyrase (YacG/DUF329 family)
MCGIMHRTSLAVAACAPPYVSGVHMFAMLRGNRRPTVEEDELGVLREMGHREYVTCSRCGMPVARSAAAIAPGDALQDHSDYRYLCPDCQKALADGEVDLPAAEE